MINWHIQTFASTDSTQNLLRNLLNEGAGEGVVIQALEQKQGRGRHGRDWVSPLGNLYMSFSLAPDCAADVAGQLSFVVAVALSRAVGRVQDGDHVRALKWPNDLLVNGKKLAGILLESDIKDGKVSYLIVGCGVNILSAPDGAIAIKDICGDKQVPIHPFRDMVLEEVNSVYRLWKEEGFERIREEWLAQAYGLNEQMSVTLADKQVKGCFVDLDEKGQLLLRTEDGQDIAINSGDIYFG